MRSLTLIAAAQTRLRRGTTPPDGINLALKKEGPPTLPQAAQV